MSTKLHVLQHSLGLDRHGQGNALTGDSACFAVTDAGRAFVAEHSPKPPKLSRSQKRYRQWLRADCGLKFGEWLKIQPHAA